MNRFRMIIISLVAGAGALGLAVSAVPAGAATVGGSPEPCPTVTVATGNTSNDHIKCPEPPRVRSFGQQDLDLILNDIFFDGHQLLHTADALLTGPVRFALGDETDPSPTLSVVSDAFGNSVNVRHELIDQSGNGTITVDRRTCSVSINDPDEFWSFAGGTGRYRNAIGAGFYTLDATLSAPTRHFHCTLPRDLSVADVLDALNNNGPELNNVNVDNFTVQGTGFSFVPRHHEKSITSPFEVPGMAGQLAG